MMKLFSFWVTKMLQVWKREAPEAKIADACQIMKWIN